MALKKKSICSPISLKIRFRLDFQSIWWIIPHSVTVLCHEISFFNMQNMFMSLNISSLKRAECSCCQNKWSLEEEAIYCHWGLVSVLHRTVPCERTHSSEYEVPLLPSKDRTLPQRAKRSDLPHPWAALPVPFQMLPGLLWGETQPIRLRGSSAGHEERNFLQELRRGQCFRACWTWRKWKDVKEIFAFQCDIVFVSKGAGSVCMYLHLDNISQNFNYFMTLICFLKFPFKHFSPFPLKTSIKATLKLLIW